MHPFFETIDLLDLVVGYIGFAPSRFYLRECSHYLYREVKGLIYLREADYFEALNRKRVNPKYLKLRYNTLSDSLISRLRYSTESDYGWTFLLESLLEGKSIDDLIHLKQSSTEEITKSSILRVNVPMFDITLKCLEARGLVQTVIPAMLRCEEVTSELMQADAVELLRMMVGKIELNREDLGKNLLLCAVKFGAQRCMTYLLGFTRSWERMPEMLEAYAYAGDLVKVKMLCCADEPMWSFFIVQALKQAIEMRHLEVADFMRSELIRRDDLTWPIDRRNLAQNFINSLVRRDNPCEPSTEFLNWYFEGVDRIADLRVCGMTLLGFACNERFRGMCRFLVHRGCRSFRLNDCNITLETDDLLEYIDLCCGLEKDPQLEPEVELFFLKRGIFLREKDRIMNPVIETLWGGYNAASFANRVDLIKQYLIKDSSLASRRDFFRTGSMVTPLGFLELLATPKTRIWDGMNVIRFGNKLRTTSDEWELAKPNEIEIQALRDIRTTLIQHGADPEILFTSDGLVADLMGGARGQISVEFIERIIRGRADVNRKNNDGDYPLSLAIRENHSFDVIRALLHARDRTFFDSEGSAAQHDTWTALLSHGAIPIPQVLSLLLDRKLDPNFRDRNRGGLTPLSRVLYFGGDKQFEIAEILLDFKADINAVDNYGRTAIFRAIALNHHTTADFLIKHGADVTIPDNRGTRPIDIARFCVETMQGSPKILEQIELMIGNTDGGDIDCLGSIQDLIDYPPRYE